LQLFEHPQGAEGAGADAVVEVEHVVGSPCRSFGTQRRLGGTGL